MWLSRGRHVGERGGGHTCFTADGFVDGALSAGRAAAGRALG